MPPSLPGKVIESVRRTVLLCDDARLTDGQLLERYLRQRDETAFAALVHRHGPMVWGVCSRALVHYQDAEDAFQATFLVLVRKANSVRPRALVGNWLYGVAHRIATSARRGQARRRQHEKQVAAMPEPAAKDEESQRELQALFDAELSRLPEKYRSVIVLCDLGGRTRKEVACQLGIPEGTLSGRLSRGRALLGRRLARCGLAVSAAAMVRPATSAPASVLTATIHIVTGPAAQVPARVSALVEGVLKAMLISKLRFATLVLLTAALLGAAVGVGQWGIATGAGEKPSGAVQAPKPTPKAPGDAPAPADDFEIFAVRHAKAADIAKTLQELLQGTDAIGLRVVADPGSNSVLVRGKRDQYKQVVAIIERLDEAAHKKAAVQEREREETKQAPARKIALQVFALKYAKAADMAKTLRELLQGDDYPGLRIAADPGSNSVLVRGRRDQIEEVASILVRLDDAAHKHYDRFRSSEEEKK